MSRGMLFLGPLLFLYLFFADSVRSVEVQVNSAKTCAFMQCDRGEHCINRKFWCRNPPCPSMLYCSKTPRDSLKGPMTCASVRCSKGYICLVRVHRCRWDQGCKQQIARCVSEKEYDDGPASCADFHCPSGHQCILRESLCTHPPCKLLKSCAKTKDVQLWHGSCKTLGCPSEYECFLRRPPENCPSTISCKHTPDCAITNVKEVRVNLDCRGWVCPRYQECSSLVPESCSSDDHIESCNVNRTCHEPLATSDIKSLPSLRLIPRMFTTDTAIRDGIWQTTNSKPTLMSHYNSGQPTRQTTASVVHARHISTPRQTDCNLNNNTVRLNWIMQFENPQNGSIYRAPVYVRSTVNRNSDEARESLSAERPGDSPITQWLDHLRLRTGVDAVNVWIKQAEENRRYGDFNEWLAAVKTTLGPFRFEIWLREIRKQTSEYPAFQEWLATNEAVPSLTEHRTVNGNGTQQKTSEMFLDQEQRSEVGSKQAHETTESPVHDHGTLMNFYPRVRSGNDRIVFAVNQLETPLNVPLRKNAGHPRINYGRNRDYKQHRNFRRPELQNETLTRYMINDPSGRLRTQEHNTDKTDTEIGYFNSVKLQINMGSKASGDYPANHSLQLDHKADENAPNLDYPIVELSNQRNNSVGNDLTLDSLTDSVVKLQKNISNDSTLQDSGQVHDVQNPLSNVVAREQEKREGHDLMNEKDSDQISRGFGNLRPETNYQSLELSGLVPNVLFKKIEDPKWNSDPRRPPVSTDHTQFTEEDQRGSSQASESPESMQRQYYQRVYELHHEVPEVHTKSRNSSSNIGVGKKKKLTKTYTLFAPAPDELRIISPWNAVQVVDHRKRTHYTLMGPLPERANDRMPGIGYPLVVSSVASVDQVNFFPQDARDFFDISQNSGTDSDQERIDPRKQILQHETIPHLPITKKSDYPTLGERRQQIYFRNRQAWPQSKHQEQNTQQSFFDDQKPNPIPTPIQNWYPWNDRIPHHHLEVSKITTLPTNPRNMGFTDLEESLKEYRGTLNSQEYVDAYVDAIIEDALSKVILDELLQEDEGPANWTNSKNSTNKRFEEEQYVLEAQFPDNNALKNIFRNQKSEDDFNVSYSPGRVQSMEDVLTDKNQFTRTSTPNLSADSIMADNDYQYECGDRSSDLHQTMETTEKSPVIEDTYSLDSASDETEEYYSEDREQQEYFERPSRHRDKYSGNVASKQI